MIKEKEYEKFFKSINMKFVILNDFNVKHSHWGSRIITVKMIYYVIKNQLKVSSSGKPITYWLMGINKT